MAEHPREVALRVDSVSKTFKVHQERASSLKQFIATGGRNRYEEFHALRNVSLDVAVGEAVGIIGHNGSGKSTLLKCMAKILTPNSGSIVINKRMAALLELGAGFHPELSGSRQRVPQRRDPRHGPQGDRAALRRDRRVLRSRAVHRRTGQDLLVGHVRAPRVRGGDQRRSRAAADRRDPGGRRRDVPAEVHGEVRPVPRRRPHARPGHPRHEQRPQLL